MNTRVAVEGHLRSAPLFLPFFLSSSAEPSNPALFRSQGAGGLEPSPASRRAHRPYTACCLLSVPSVLPSLSKPHTTPHRRQRLAFFSSSWRLDPDSLRSLPGAFPILYCGAIFEGPAPPNPDPECDPEYRKPPWSGQERPSGFGGFQAQKAQEALGRSGLTTGPQLITRRSEVQVLSPQP